MTDPETLVLLAPYLQRGEKVVWTGRPAQGLRFSGLDILLIPFGALWTAQVASMQWQEWQAFLKNPPPFGALLFFALIGVLLLGAGCLVTIGRFLIDLWVRRSAVYALTDRRALTRFAWPRVKIVDAALAGAGTIVLREERGGRGTLSFDNDDPTGGRGLKLSVVLSFLESAPSFVGISKAQDVYRLAVEGRGAALAAD